jgi:hypothetical protein
LDKFFGQNTICWGNKPENLMRAHRFGRPLILNGNDYLPKLRGSSGFNKLFHSFCASTASGTTRARVIIAVVDPH